MKILSKKLPKTGFGLPSPLPKDFYKTLGYLVFAGHVIFTVTFVNAQQLDANFFPRPAELESAINFWVRVYTEVDTDSGFLHDSKDLSIIYAQLNRNIQGVESRRQQIKDNLAAVSYTHLTLPTKRIV